MFDAKIARKDLRRFHRRGPDPATSQLLRALQAASLPPSPTLLDIGGGIGAIHHTLLSRGFAQATQIDASNGYLAMAAAEAASRGHTDRLRLIHADFHQIAQTTEPADVVTLDRVVCCDPDFVDLLGAAADHARRFLAYTYPRPHWLTRLVVGTNNTYRRLRGQGFRAYVHSPEAMTSVLEGRGLRRRWSGGTWIWRAELFERAA